MLGRKFKNNREGSKDYGRIATVVRYDDTAKSCVLQFDDGNGAVPLSTSTLKRWWKKVEVEESTESVSNVDTPVIEQENKVVDPDNTASDGTSYSEVLAEIIHDEKVQIEQVKKQRKASASAVDRDSVKSDILHVLDDNGLGYLTYEKFPGVVVVKQGKKSIFELRITRKGITFNCRVDDVPKGIKYATVKNYYMPATIKTSDNFMEVFNTLLNTLTKEEK